MGRSHRRRRSSRRRRLLTRAVPLLLLVVVAAGAAVLILARNSGASERQVVTRYIHAWARSDFPVMYSLLDPASQSAISERAFAAVYRNAASTATETSIVVVRVGKLRSDAITVRVRVGTRLFGIIRGTIAVPVLTTGSTPLVRFSQIMAFPGLRPGERLHREVTLAPRATLFASNGVPLAEGPNRTSPIPGTAAGIVGGIGPIPADEQAMYKAEGYPANAKVGLDGLERIFQSQLAGSPGGKLMAGTRTLATRRVIPGQDVHTTIDPSIETAVIDAIGARYAGIVALDPSTGAVLGVAGVGFSALQPPGSTMKIITSTAALGAGLVKLTDTFPVQSSATIDGYTLQNAGGEACGGTLINAFAVSCNSVFAPLGVKVGAQRLVGAAERYGFNQPSSIPAAGESQIPSASAIGDDLAVGSSAIGQGRVLASALEMTDVAATIAMGGKRPVPTLQAGQSPRFVNVTSGHVAREIQEMMVAVVQYGTGTPAEIPGITIAGKTGTAELKDTALPGNSDNPNDTDSWFVGYGPVGSPKLVVGALFPNQGAGAETAAPAVREVLEAGLH